MQYVETPNEKSTRHFAYFMGCPYQFNLADILVILGWTGFRLSKRKTKTDAQTACLGMLARRYVFYSLSRD
jgi:hypothetical protein